MRVRIFSIKYRVTGSKELVVDLFGRREDGKRAHYVLHGSEPWFAVPDEAVRGSVPGAVRVERGAAKSLNGRSLTKIVCAYPFNVPDLRNNFLETFEADVTYDQRVRYDYKIRCNIDVPADKQDITAADITPLDMDSGIIAPRYVILDIETYDRKGFAEAKYPTAPVVSIAAWDSFSGKYICILNTEIEGPMREEEKRKAALYFAEKEWNVQLIEAKDEAMVFSYFAQFIGSVEPDLICDWSLRRDGENGFDFPYLQNRAEKCGYISVPWRNYELFDLMAAYEKLHEGEVESKALDFVAKELGLPGKNNDGRRTWQLLRDNKADLVTYNCVEENQRVLMADLTWKKAKDITIGDQIGAFDEEGVMKRGKKRRVRKFKTGTITRKQISEAECYRITLEDGTSVVATADHKWLVGRKTAPQVPDGFGRWVETRELVPSSRTVSRWGHVHERKHVRPNAMLLRATIPVQTLDSFDGGWMSGFVDGEGCLSDVYGVTRVVSISQKPGKTLENALRILRENKFKFEVSPPMGDRSTTQVFIRGGLTETLRFLQTFRPQRLLSKFSFDKLSSVERCEGVSVVSVESVGIKKIVKFSTDANTFIAEGILTHNCNDVFLTKEIDSRKNLVSFFSFLLAYAGRGIEEGSFSAQRLIDSYVSHKLAGTGIVQPTGEAKIVPDYQGGKVMRPAKGIFHNVIEVDLSSMYPSAIRQFNMSPETIVGPEYNGPCYVLPSGNRYRKDFRGLFPRILDELVAERIKLKNQGREEEQRVVKELANSVYGLMGAKYYRLADVRVASDITWISRETLDLNWSVIEQEAPIHIKNHSDTDSCAWSYLDNPTYDEAKARGLRIVDKMKAAYRPFVRKFGVEDHEPLIIDIKLEHVYTSYVHSGAPKRYYCYYPDPKGKIRHGDYTYERKVRGFEFRRSSSAPLTKTVQDRVFDMIGFGQDHEVVPYLRGVVKDLKSGKIPIMECRLPIAIKMEGYKNPNIDRMRAIRWSNEHLGSDWKAGDKPTMLFAHVQGKPTTDVIALEWNATPPDGLVVDWPKTIERVVLSPLQHMFDILEVSPNDIIDPSHKNDEFF